MQLGPGVSMKFGWKLYIWREESEGQPVEGETQDEDAAHEGGKLRKCRQDHSFTTSGRRLAQQIDRFEE